MLDSLILGYYSAMANLWGRGHPVRQRKRRPLRRRLVKIDAELLEAMKPFGYRPRSAILLSYRTQRRLFITTASSRSRSRLRRHVEQCQR